MVVGYNGEHGTIQVMLELQDCPYNSRHLKLQDCISLLVGLEYPRDEVHWAVLARSRVSLQRRCKTSRRVPLFTVCVDKFSGGGPHVVTQIRYKFPRELHVRVTNPLHLEFGMSRTASSLPEYVLYFPGVLAVNHAGRRCRWAATPSVSLRLV